MIRPFTCVCLLLAAGAGLYTYQAKHQSELLDREIARVLKAADAARQRSGVLRAEYALLNDPSRLADLATTHLPELHATEPRQFTSLSELDRRLPPVGAMPSIIPPIVEPPVLEPAPVKVIPIASSQAPAAPAAKPAGPAAGTPQVAALPTASVVGPVKSAPPAATRLSVAAQGVPPIARARAPVMQKVATARPSRVEPFITQASAPTEALARLAQSPSITGAGIGTGTGGATVSALGMARSATLIPAAQGTR